MPNNISLIDGVKQLLVLLGILIEIYICAESKLVKNGKGADVQVLPRELRNESETTLLCKHRMQHHPNITVRQVENFERKNEDRI